MAEQEINEAVKEEMKRKHVLIVEGNAPDENTYLKRVFIHSFNEQAEEINQNAIKKGWWEGERNDGEMIALMHSELSECLEALRHGNPPDSHIPEFKGSEAELADVIIRIMDYGVAKGLRIAEAIIAKSEYNKGREYKHGGKEF